MDATRFDALTRSLTTSHRTTRKTFLGVGFGLLLAGGHRDAAAACKKVGRACTGDNACCKNAECQGGVCQCKTGFTDCSGKCKDLSTNTNHCGACDNGCGRGETCCSGDCTDSDFQSDHDHCGSCGTVCGDTEICIIGLCQPCPADGVFCGECCTPPIYQCCHGECIRAIDNPTNCGACDLRCLEPGCCSFGQCVDDFESDRHNCGACGVDCNAGTLCCNGRCAVDCGGRCCQGFERCVSGHCIIV